MTTPEDTPKVGRSRHEVPGVDGPDYVRGMVEQTSPAPHVNDVVLAAAALTAARIANPGDSENRDRALKEAELLGVDYQRAGQIRQMLAERANAVAYGQTDRIEGIDRALRENGYTGDLTIGAGGDPSKGPVGRATRSEKTVQAADAPPETPSASSSTRTGTSSATAGKATPGKAGAPGTPAPGTSPKQS